MSVAKPTRPAQSQTNLPCVGYARQEKRMNGETYGNEQTGDGSAGEASVAAM